MLVWLTRFYLSFNALVIECHIKYFHLAWENNHAICAKQRSSCKDVYRVHDNSKVWLLLNFHELQTEEFLEFSLLSKNLLKLNIKIQNKSNYFNHTLQKLGQHISTPAEHRKSI